MDVIRNLKSNFHTLAILRLKHVTSGGAHFRDFIASQVQRNVAAVRRTDNKVLGLKNKL